MRWRRRRSTAQPCAAFNMMAAGATINPGPRPRPRGESEPGSRRCVASRYGEYLRLFGSGLGHDRTGHRLQHVPDLLEIGVIAMIGVGDFVAGTQRVIGQ